MKRIVLTIALLLVVCLGMTSCKHEHKWSEWQASKNVTCTQDGINTRVCDDCGESQSVPLFAPGHIWGEWNTIKQSSCTENGYKERRCSCGQKETQILNATGHSFGSWKVTKEATCTVDGIKQRICTCGEQESERIIASHNWKKANCVEAKTCIKCGLTEGTAIGHTCTLGECANCGETIYPTVELPSTPFTVHDGNDTMKFTEISYHFDSKENMVISFAGEKTYGVDYNLVVLFCSVFDEDGYLLGTYRWDGTRGLTTGDKFKDSITIFWHDLNGSSKYTIKFNDRK